VIILNRKTEKNPKGAGRTRKLSSEQEKLVVQRYKEGVLPYEIMYEFKISEKTYFRILKRVYDSPEEH